MSWITITAAKVAERLTAPELTALKTAAKSGSQDGDVMLADAISRVVKKVRGYVAGCKRNTLGDGDTIPDELEGAALALIRNELFTRLPGMKTLNDEIRQQETKDAYAELKDAAACKLAIVPPETEAPQQASGPAVQTVGRRRRLTGRSRTKGLL